LEGGRAVEAKRKVWKKRELGRKGRSWSKGVNPQTDKEERKKKRGKSVLNH